LARRRRVSHQQRLRGRGIMAVKITRDVLEGYLNCEYKGWLQLGGEEGQKSDYEMMATDLRRQLHTRVVADLLARQVEGGTWQGAILAPEMLKEGLSVIVNATLVSFLSTSPPSAEKFCE